MNPPMTWGTLPSNSSTHIPYDRVRPYPIVVGVGNSDGNTYGGGGSIPKSTYSTLSFLTIAVLISVVVMVVSLLLLLCDTNESELTDVLVFFGCPINICGNDTIKSREDKLDTNDSVVTSPLATDVRISVSGSSDSCLYSV